MTYNEYLKKFHELLDTRRGIFIAQMLSYDFGHKYIQSREWEKYTTISEFRSVLEAEYQKYSKSLDNLYQEYIESLN